MHFNGSALVAFGDAVLLDKGYGLADTAKAIANGPTTRFRIASVTKQFTAMAILILESRGKLDVDDKACKYVADCPAAWKAITIRQLLSHSAGIPNFTDLPDYESTKGDPTTVKELFARFKDLPLQFTPGSRFSYSNSNYVVLGSIIERASKVSYEDFVKRNIFDPLEMHDTGYEHPDSGVAVGYKREGVVADTIDMSVPYAAGALYSTVEDLRRWGQALSSEDLVPKTVLATMFEPSGLSMGIDRGRLRLRCRQHDRERPPQDLPRRRHRWLPVRTSRSIRTMASCASS